MSGTLGSGVGRKSPSEYQYGLPAAINASCRPSDCTQKNIRKTTPEGLQNRVRAFPKPAKIEAQGLQESQDAPKRCPRPARRRPRAPKGQPRSAQEARKGAQEPPKSGQDSPKRRPGGSQNRSKTSLASPRTNFMHDVGGKLCVKGSWNDFSLFFSLRATFAYAKNLGKT